MSASTTTAENAYNLQTARRTVAVQLGVDPANMEYDERIIYNRALAGFILQYPAGFTPAQLQSASIVANKNYMDLADTSFDWSQFGGLFVENAGNLAVAGVSWLKPLSIVAVLGVAAFYILPGAISRASKSSA